MPTTHGYSRFVGCLHGLFYGDIPQTSPEGTIVF